MDNRSKILLQRHVYLKQRRMLHENTIQELVDLFLPFRGDITTRKSPGQKRVTGVFDSTGVQAADRFTNWLMGVMLPKNTQWLRIRHSEFGDVTEIQQLLGAVANKFLQALDASNFYVEAATMIKDFGVLGNATLKIEEDVPRLKDQTDDTFGGFIFRALPFLEVMWSVDRNGKPSSVVREVEMPALDAARFFENPGANVRRYMRDGRYMETVKYLHFVFKNENDVPGGFKANTNKRWVSIFLADHAEHTDSAMIVEEGGFDDNPYIISRMDIVAGDWYGRGRGHLVRGDAAGLNEGRRQILNAVGRDLRPFLLVANESVLNTDGGKSSIMTLRNDHRDQVLPQYLHSGVDYTAADSVFRLDRQQIRDAFLGDILDEPDTEPRSAEESRQRQFRALSRMSAVADRVEAEFLDPLVTTGINMMAAAGALPELERVGQMTGESEMDIKFQYVSPFFAAQRMNMADRIENYVARVGSLAVNLQRPDMLDAINFDKVVSMIRDLGEVPADIQNLEQDVLELREARAQQATRQQALEIAQQGSEINRNLTA